ncbi:GlyGly-CTERM sorting domain-containing protein [Pseudomonas sp. HK3]
MLISSSAFSAVDNQFIKSLDASRITLAGSLGKAAMFAVQADDDDDLEIFTTASSIAHYDNDRRDIGNDHWILLDRSASDTDYNIIARGELQSPGNYYLAPKTVRAYLSSFQVNHQKILLGHDKGKLTTIEFVDNPDSNQHTILSNTLLLTDILPNEGADLGLGFDPNEDGINSIVSLTGTNKQEYIILCTDGLIHAYDETQKSIISSVNYVEIGKGCLTGNIDYEKVNDEYDEELIVSTGYVYTFNGLNFVEKIEFKNTFEFDPKNSHLANIDDDLALELLQQMGSTEISPDGSNLVRSAVNYKSLTNASPWVLMPSTANADYHFDVVDSDDNGISDILFNYIDYEVTPNQVKIVQVAWDTNLDSHIIKNEVNSPLPELATIKYLPTTLTNGTPSNYYYFLANTTGDTPSATKHNPLNPLLSRLNSDLSVSWSGLISTAAKSFDIIAKTQADNTLNDFNLVQLEQANLDGNEDYFFTYKKFDITNFDMVDIILPDFLDNEITSVNVLSAFDLDVDGIDELHIAGQASYTTPSGIILSSNLDGSDYGRIDALNNITNMQFGNYNNSLTPDIFASEYGYEDGTSVSYLFHFDNISTALGNYDTEALIFSEKTDFNKAIPLNIKGDNKLEILGINDKNLYSYNLNPLDGENDSYHLNGQDLSNFTPIKLHSRDYNFALASSASGLLYLIEPKNMEILVVKQACDEEFSIINSIRADNNADVALAVCGQTLKSWFISYDEEILDHGYTLVDLPDYDLGNVTTYEGQIIPLTTDEGISLITLFKNQYLRLSINNEMFNDDDDDGYLNFQDHFPTETSQWSDDDLDGLGDNPAPASNPDPSLNDIDNDGVLDDADPDNNPENDFDPSNDSDNGAPIFINTFDTVHTSSANTLTTISIITPTATDVFDDHNATDILISASTNGLALSQKIDNHEIDLVSGRHSILWKATDNAGNTTSANQIVNLYPSVAFTQSTSTIGEGQSSIIEVTLSGESPVYPFDVEVTVNSTSANNADVNEDITTNLTVRFESSETSKTFTLSALDDDIAESDETLTLSIADTFSANSWTINPVKNTHILTIVDVNEAPVVSIESEQNGAKTTSPDHISGIITLSSIVTDANNIDAHTYLWDLSSLGLGNSLLNTVTISPEVITPGVYTFTLTVTDNGLPAKSTMATFTLNYIYGDSDADGVADNLDKFPTNPNEWADNDGDGFGDEEEDRFPEDATEHADDDNDGTGNNADPFDDNPNETKDTDNDGVGDNSDAFPKDFNEQVDSDGDKVGDNTDAFPKDPSEQYDSDGDGVGNNADAFPQDPKETKDSDGDRVGDNSDLFPFDAKRSKEEKVEEKEKEEDGFGSGGSLPFFWLLILLPLLIVKRKTY